MGLSILRVYSMVLSVLWLSSCGDSELLSRFKSAADKQTAILETSLSLWKRSPTKDAANSALKSSDDLEKTVPRSTIYFSNIVDIRSPLASSNLTMKYSELKPSAPTFFEWAAEKIPWTHDDFRMFTAYYHADAALTYIQANFPTAYSTALTNKALPLKIYAAASGSALDTGYDFSSASVSLIKHAEGAGAGFSPADEGDAVYHEMAHLLQYALNKTAMDSLPSYFSYSSGTESGNADFDLLLEGLADFFAASVLRDESILTYFSSNAPNLFDASNRTGTSQNRKLGQTLSFGNNFYFQAHLDGRVVASALNEYRKYLEGKTVTLANCSSSCTRQLTADTVSAAVAWDDVNKLAYQSFASMTSDMSLHQYGVQLGTDCSTSAYPTTCAVFQEILESRGVRSKKATINGAVNAAFNGATTHDLSFSSTLGWIPFPNDTGFANTNSTIEPCEVILVFPNFKNNSNSAVSGTGVADYYNIVAKISSISGMTDLNFPGTSIQVEATATSAGRLSKIMGWLEPGFWTQDLIGSTTSAWYTKTSGNSFARQLSATYFPTDVGWLGRAPATTASSIQVIFNVTLSRYNSAGVAANRTLVGPVTQNVTVAGTDNTFCTNQ